MDSGLAAAGSQSSGVLARLRRWPALAVLVGWSLFLWLSRLRNVIGNDDLDTWGLTWRVVVVVIFVALAVLAARHPEPWVVATLVWWTVGFWVLRGGGILLDDHSTGFKAIHTALMAVSIATGMWVWQTRHR